MMTTIEQQIADAIRKSELQNEIIHVEVDLPRDGFFDTFAWLTHTEWDYAAIDGSEGEKALDIWGWDDETPEGESDWRIVVHFA